MYIYIYTYTYIYIIYLEYQHIYIYTRSIIYIYTYNAYIYYNGISTLIYVYELSLGYEPIPNWGADIQVSPLRTSTRSRPSNALKPTNWQGCPLALHQWAWLFTGDGIPSGIDMKYVYIYGIYIYGIYILWPI